jgi:hypothetical protein
MEHGGPGPGESASEIPPVQLMCSPSLSAREVASHIGIEHDIATRILHRGNQWAIPLDRAQRVHGPTGGANHPSGVKADPTGGANMAGSTVAGRSRVRQMVGMAEGI